MAITTQAEADAAARQAYEQDRDRYQQELSGIDNDTGDYGSVTAYKPLSYYQDRYNTMLSNYQTNQLEQQAASDSLALLDAQYNSADNTMSITEYMAQRDAITGGTGTRTTVAPSDNYSSTSGTVVGAVESKTPKAGLDSAVPNNLGIQTQTQQISTRDQLIGNITDPNIPESGKQTYTALSQDSNQFQDARLVGDGTPITAREGQVTEAGVTSANASTYQASTVTGQTPVASAAQSAVDKLVDPQTGKLTNEAKAAQGVLDPAALVDAATSTVSPDGTAVAQTADLETKATMVGQLQGLLTELEGGNVPTWARPAVEQVESMLAQRGMSKSSIGRDALFNAIIQAALPIAQNDAQAQAQRGSQNLNNRQQTALFNAQNVLQMDMANLSNEQQARLMNSQAIQTMTLTNVTNEQQAAMTNAANWAAMDTANLSAAMTAQVHNAQNFLSMNMANLSNEQQANLVNQQSKMQALLTDQAAENAAKQFNAGSETQVSTFMAQLGSQISQFNATQANAMEQYNVGNETAVQQFNEQVNFQREQFNAQMYNQIEQSNVAWRRQMNQIDTAGLNAVNQANAINAFNMSNQALTLAWQDLRDSASWAFQAGENDQEKATRMAIAALSNEQEGSSTSASAWSALGGWVATLLK